MEEDNKTFYIKVSSDGPYLVFGNPPIDQEIIISNDNCNSWFYRKGLNFNTENKKDPVALCRCGKSKDKPFCDGSHKSVEWDSKETYNMCPYSEFAKKYEGPLYTLEDNEQFCTHAQFCLAYQGAWELVMMANNNKEEEILKHEVSHCPGGRLVLRNHETGKILEYPFPPSLGIIENPGMKISGPIWVKGGIRIESADNRTYEIRNRVALCRCGNSKNKPFCDGTHTKIKFNDGLPLDGNDKEW